MRTMCAVSLSHATRDTTAVRPFLPIRGRERSAVDTVVVKSGTSSSVGRVLGNRYNDDRRKGAIFRLHNLYLARNNTKLRQSTTTSPLDSVNDLPVRVFFLDPVYLKISSTCSLPDDQYTSSIHVIYGGIVHYSRK